MKTLFYLIASMVLATLFGLLLVKTGVVEFHSDEAMDKLKPLAETAFSKATNALPDYTPEGDATQSLPKVPLPSQTAQKDSSIEDTDPAGEVTMPPENDHGSDDKAKALDFLVGFSGQDASRIEDQFARFLSRELKLESLQIDRIVRMSFWKSFVTLQDKWKAGEAESLNREFAREMELKKAGFAARGLTLMENEIREAKARLQAIQQQLQTKVTKGEAT